MQAFGLDIIDWINFAVFLNAWNLSSNELSVHSDLYHRRLGIWHIVDGFLEKHISKQITTMGSNICSLGVDLPILVQLVTEPLAWHGLVIQSCIRSSLPSGKKKKKGGSTDQSSSLPCAIRDSIQSLCGMLEEITKWAREHIKRPEDINVEFVLSSLRKKEHESGPGEIFRILESWASSINEAELGDRISQGVRSWSSVDVARKLVKGDSKLLNDFVQICELKIKSFRALKQQIGQP